MNTEERRHYTIEDVQEGLIQEMLEGGAVIVPQKVIYIPRINDGTADFAELFRIWDEVNDYFEDVKFDFSQCSFLRPNAVAFLEGDRNGIGVAS